MADPRDWVDAVARSAKTKVFQVVAEGGLMDVKFVTQNHTFTEKVKDFFETYMKHSKDAADHSVQIYKKSIDLANCINNLARSFEAIGKMNKKV